MVKRVSLKGKGAELFFGGLQPAEPDADPVVQDEPESPVVEPPASPRSVGHPANGHHRPSDGAAARPRRTSPARKTASTDASMRASSESAELVETVRRVVKTLGKEVSFVRLTAAEKEELGELIYAFKQQGVKTTENEINRIAINVILADHRANGDASQLTRVLAALRA